MSAASPSCRGHCVAERHLHLLPNHLLSAHPLLGPLLLAGVTAGNQKDDPDLLSSGRLTGQLLWNCSMDVRRVPSPERARRSLPRWAVICFPAGSGWVRILAEHRERWAGFRAQTLSGNRSGGGRSYGSHALLGWSHAPSLARLRICLPGEPLTFPRTLGPRVVLLLTSSRYRWHGIG